MLALVVVVGTFWGECLQNPLRRVFAVPLAGAGTATTGVVRCDQPRALDLGARGGRKLESVPDAIVDEVLAKIATVFE